MTTRRASDTEALPSGSLPWVVWSLGGLFFCYGFFQRVAPSVMVEDLMRDFAVSAAVLGNLAAFYFYAYAGMQLPLGIMVDRWGARRILAAGSLLCGLGSLLFATADSLAPAYLGRLLIGGGAGFAFVGTLKLAAGWFPPKRFALVSGLTSLLAMVGAVGGQAPLALVVAATGWRETLLGAAIFALVLSVSIWFIVRDPPAAKAALPQVEPAGLLDGLRRVTTIRQSWICALYCAAMTATMSSFAVLWGVPYMMQAYGLPRAAAAASISLFMIGWAIGAPLVGWLSDHIGRRRLPMVLAAWLALGSFALLVYLPGLPLRGGQTLLLINGMASSTMHLAFVTAREHNPSRAAGTAVSFVNTIVMGSGALFQPFLGLLLDINWDGRMEAGARVYSLDAFQVALLPLLACGVLAVSAAFLVRETHCRMVWERG
ncbi:MAG: MFS transporter [Alphaproteobacteria bacterium]